MAYAHRRRPGRPRRRYAQRGRGVPPQVLALGALLAPIVAKEIGKAVIPHAVKAAGKVFKKKKKKGKGLKLAGQRGGVYGYKMNGQPKKKPGPKRGKRKYRKKPLYY